MGTGGTVCAGFFALVRSPGQHPGRLPGLQKAPIPTRRRRAVHPVTPGALAISAQVEGSETTAATCAAITP